MIGGRRPGRSALAVLLLLGTGCEVRPAPEASAGLGRSCPDESMCGVGGLCVGANACSSGVCSQPCDPAGACPDEYRCSTFETIDQEGRPVARGYCLRACEADPDCDSRVCDDDLRVCVTPSLRYDVGSPPAPEDPSCVELPAHAGPFGGPTSLTEGGELLVSGPTIALDPADPAVRYVAYNSLAGTDVSVSRDGGASWTRNAIPGGFSANIGDPALAVDPTSGEVWHSFLMAAQVECELDRTTDSSNSIGITSSHDQGATWSFPVVAGVGPYESGTFLDRPSIAAVGDRVLVTFVAVPAATADVHTDVALTRSADRGQSWSVSPVSDPARATLRRAPAMVLAGGAAIIVAWVEKDGHGVHGGSIWIARSTDGGRTFAERRISQGLLAREDGPSVAVSDAGRSVFVVFGAIAAEGVAGDGIYLARSSDAGATFEAPVRLTHTCGTAWNPTSAVDDAGSLWAIWYQAVAGISRVAWLKLNDPRTTGAVDPEIGFIRGSDSPFTMSRSPLVSLGDFVGLASSRGTTVAAWTSLGAVATGGKEIVVSGFQNR